MILGWFVAVATAADFPTPARVVDQPLLLSDGAKSSIMNTLAQHEQSTGNQVVLVIVNDLAGLPVEDYANQLARKWGVGQKGKNNGVVILIGWKERKLRIEVGYGLEHQLPDAKARRIISNAIPYLKAKRYDDAARQLTSEVIDSIRR